MYFSEDEKERIEKEAAAEGKTISGYCRDLMQERRQEKEQNDLVDELDAEARLAQTLDDGFDQFEQLAEGIERQNGTIIAILRELESQLDGVDLDTDQDQDRTTDRDGKVDDVDELL